MSSKFSLYDFFAMIIPGGIVMAILLLRFDCDFIQIKLQECGCKIILINEPSAWMCVVLIIVSYFLGLVNNGIADVFFSAFRNNGRAIASEKMRVSEGYENYNSKDGSRSFIYISYQIFFDILLSPFPCRKKRKRYPDYTYLYYSTYYNLISKHLLGSVPIIEAQVALLRNSILPLVGLGITIAFLYEYSCIYAITLAIVILLYLIMVQRQNKVYRMIWEAKKFYDL